MVVEELVTKLGLEIDTGALAVLEKFRATVSDGMKSLAVGASAVGAAFVGIVSHAAHAADEIGDMADKLGVNAEALQELRVASELSDVSFESLTAGLKFVAKNAAEAAAGSKEAAEAFAGIATKDAQGQLLTADELLMNVAKRFESIQSPAEKTRLAMKIFGRAGTELIPMLNRGAEGIAEFRREAQEMGVVFGKEALEQADDFGRELIRVKFAMEGLRNTFAVPFFKVFVAGVKLLVGVLKSARPAIEEVSKGFVSAGQRMAGVGRVVMGVVNAIREGSGVFGDWLRSILGNVKWIKVLEALLVGLGVVFVATAAAAIGAWVAAAAPFLFLAALIGFIVDDIRAFIEGGDSVIGRLQKWASVIGDPNEHVLVRLLRTSLALMMDLTDPQRWTRLASAAVAAVAQIISVIPGGKLVTSILARQAATASGLAGIVSQVATGTPILEAAGYSQGAGFEDMERRGIAFRSAQSKEPTGPNSSSAPQASFQPITNITINGSQLSGEELQSRVENAINASYSKALPAVSGGAQ